MMAGKRRVLGAAFKAKVALTAAKEDRTANLRLFDRIDRQPAITMAGEAASRCC
jgi:hypothetical protein